MLASGRSSSAVARTRRLASRTRARQVQVARVRSNQWQSPCPLRSSTRVIAQGILLRRSAGKRIRRSMRNRYDGRTRIIYGLRMCVPFMWGSLRLAQARPNDVYTSIYNMPHICSYVLETCRAQCGASLSSRPYIACHCSLHKGGMCQSSERSF